MNIWYLGKNAPFEREIQLPLIRIPLIRTISTILKHAASSIDQYGDMTMFTCESQIPYFEPSFAEAHDIDRARIIKFMATINATQKSMRADEILVRIPPVYVSSQAVPTFENYLSYIHTTFREHGITLLGTEHALTTDPTKMCFGPNHPTKEAREEYTDALIQELTAHKQLVLQ